ncbi:MAG: hypothetical protein PWQ15_648 [Methanobacterium sp.]|jgi:uncharacterized protein YeaO (DUF488 family)|uniref:DUF488 domain-containing protein n=1 Tax=Methanobacterium sp. TaxID=2164 RepID=UPI0003C9F055|nr:DUF488 family protein [Methanobacterium sp.]MDI3549546.1 hypothetical protein [Methanobacterium sp.]CDG65141.1 hypothetical protein MBMB1_1040 [Methanobacterium sp. MB1]
MIQIKRAYDEVSKDDGFRILVDRLWPRGLSKEKLKIDLWLKEIAPSIELRKSFNHDPDKWDWFRTRYKEELKEKSELVSNIKKLEEEKGKVTLVYAAKDNKHNNALVLQELLSN